MIVDWVGKHVLEDSMRTHAEYEAMMCPGLDIVLRRSAEKAQHPPSPSWYETMDLNLPPAPPLPEGLIDHN